MSDKKTTAAPKAPKKTPAAERPAPAPKKAKANPLADRAELKAGLTYTIKVKDTVGASFTPKLTDAEVLDALEALLRKAAKADGLDVAKVSFEVSADERRIIGTATCSSAS